ESAKTAADPQKPVHTPENREADHQKSKQNFVNDLFQTPVAEPKTPEMLQPQPQLEFAPLISVEPTLQPDILQPNPQAEFRRPPEAIAPEPQISQVDESRTRTAGQQTPQSEPAPAAFINVLRVIALLLIVIESVAAPIVTQLDSISALDWWSGSSLFFYGKVGLPLFAMCSGYLLLKPESAEPWETFLYRRFIKVMVPFLAWMAIYTVWQIGWVGNSVSGLDSIIGLFQAPVFHHLWLIQILATLYVLTPPLNHFLKGISRDNVLYILVGWVGVTAVLPLLNQFTEFQFSVEVFITLEFVGFYLLGYYLRPITLNYSQRVTSLAAIVLASLITRAMFNATSAEAIDLSNNIFVQYTSLNIMVMAVSLFLFVKSLDFKQAYQRYPWFQTIIRRVSPTSFGVYLIYVLLLDEVGSGRLGIELNAFIAQPLISIPVLTIAVIAISSLVV
ncbi:MAG: acyltransferase family protein, partial [Chloroflexota bacterium]